MRAGSCLTLASLFSFCQQHDFKVRAGALLGSCASFSLALSHGPAWPSQPGWVIVRRAISEMMYHPLLRGGWCGPWTDHATDGRSLGAFQVLCFRLSAVQCRVASEEAATGVPMPHALVTFA